MHLKNFWVPLEFKLDNPDFQLLAKSFGIPGNRIIDTGGLSAAVREALTRDVPTLIEVAMEAFDCSQA